MTFHGAEKVYQGYNVMGVARLRWNPAVRYLAATSARATFASRISRRTDSDSVGARGYRD